MQDVLPPVSISLSFASVYVFMPTVSMQTLAQDVQALRKGIDITLYEREKQSQNFVIFISYSTTSSFPLVMMHSTQVFAAAWSECYSQLNWFGK